MEEKNQKVLMMEEDRFLRKIYKNKMNLAGFNFVEATNGLEGLSKLSSEKPDLVLLDVLLPRKSGFDVLIEMRRNPETQSVPVIILSNLSQESDIKKGLSLGAQEYLVKAEVSLSDVVEKTKEWLAKTKQ